MEQLATVTASARHRVDIAGWITAEEYFPLNTGAYIQRISNADSSVESEVFLCGYEIYH